MHTFKIGRHYLYIGCGWDRYSYLKKDKRWILRIHRDLVFLRRKLIRRLVFKFAGDEPVFKVLLAHGATDQNQWLIRDGSKVMKLQDLVTKYESPGSILLIGLCNPGNVSLTAQKSILIHPNKSVSIADGAGGRAGLRVFVPGFGYCDSHCQLKKAIEHFSKKPR